MRLPVQSYRVTATRQLRSKAGGGRRIARSDSVPYMIQQVIYTKYIIMEALTTVFTPSPWCSNRFAVFIDDIAPGTSTLPPSSGWIDPSFTKCIPTQYTTPYPTFSPGVCPAYMQIVKHTFGVHSALGKLVIDDASGFSPLSIDDEYICTSAITTPMAFLLDPDISTADVYTTLPPELWIEHDQVTVQWQPSDLKLFPVSVASQYELMMGITPPPSTEGAAVKTTKVVVSSTTTLTLTKTRTTSVLWGTASSSYTNNRTWQRLSDSVFTLPVLFVHLAAAGKAMNGTVISMPPTLPPLHLTPNLAVTGIVASCSSPVSSRSSLQCLGVNQSIGVRDLSNKGDSKTFLQNALFRTLPGRVLGNARICAGCYHRRQPLLWPIAACLSNAFVTQLINEPENLLKRVIAQGTGTGDWADAYAQAKELVSLLSLEEKVNLTGGISVDSSCSGVIPSIPRVNFTGLCLSDAGNGPRTTNFVSSWPAGLSVGASWNRELAHKRAVGMGGEFRAKGVNILLGPVVGPLGRIASSGRNWEGFSNDPYLCGALAYQTVGGVQSTGVITSTKHFIANEQETNRNPEGDVFAVSANIDDKTMHELYLWPFQDAVKAGTGNIMCSTVF
ncbi:hypothetical protein O1611_g434 [Lasiodiplodia mahajangana]|uniref:Uncharacterized protein n=1 Tax=Lasiodiplodia mahajangana TaxID=1108764 RepID=A0ACC2K0D5_9PEZI|nr:hypothetical protein O1611_g434 [Lasiodiplodia mahajangana]